MVLAPEAGTDPHDAALRAAAVRAASGALEEVRRLGRGAVPPLLAQMGLVEALRACAEAADLPCALRVDGPPPLLSADVERAVHRAVATLVDDAARCGATGVEIRVGPATGGVLPVLVGQDAWSTGADDDLADRVGAVRGRWERSVREGRSVGRLEVPCG
jgi:signal transduction histidine kinase